MSYNPDVVRDGVFETPVAFGAKRDGVPKPFPVTKSSEESTTSQVTPRQSTTNSNTDLSAQFTSNS
jgi:hypothetical protein